MTTNTIDNPTILRHYLLKELKSRKEYSFYGECRLIGAVLQNEYTIAMRLWTYPIYDSLDTIMARATINLKNGKVKVVAEGTGARKHNYKVKSIVSDMIEGCIYTATQNYMNDCLDSIQEVKRYYQHKLDRIYGNSVINNQFDYDILNLKTVVQILNTYVNTLYRIRREREEKKLAKETQ